MENNTVDFVYNVIAYWLLDSNLNDWECFIIIVESIIFFKNKSAKTHFHVTSPMEERPNEGKLRSGNQI